MQKSNLKPLCPPTLIPELLHL
uniref:Uncharacterized protein n=1 Tax=Anguilla anguilla TaxID=7936 RepID=A0A0E9PA15_ANGAN